MNKILFAFAILAIAMAGCSKSDDTPDRPDGYDNLRDSVGTATRPDDWTVSVETDPTSVQTITITTAEMPTVVMDEDIVAAFEDNECRAVAYPVVEPNGKTAFTLVVMAKIDEATSKPIDLHLRYYSKHNKRIYYSDYIRFRPGETLGSLNTGGYAPKWK